MKKPPKGVAVKAWAIKVDDHILLTVFFEKRSEAVTQIKYAPPHYTNGQKLKAVEIEIRELLRRRKK